MLRRGQLLERKNYSGQHCGIESRTYRDNISIYLAVSVKSYTHFLIWPYDLACTRSV